MSDIIRLLPDSVANQIAAGEVIQRPASVVKELVENAVDAGATEVHVLVTDAGRTCIQVIDNGRGMSEVDARLSFERHATSKITQATDLFDLHTMGFRGEALASIAAVAEVELKTRPEGEDLGTRVVIAGSHLQVQEPVACARGSNFSVRNLFYNVPARRKFLKSNSTELSNILQEFERVALVYPDVAFYLYSNDADVLRLPVAHNLRQRILAVFGKKLNQQLLDVAVDTTLIRLSGYVGSPDASRKKGSHQYFFVNGRYMRHPYFHRAVMDAYDRLIPTGEQVPYFIYMQADPKTIDINIHPTKTEIKFENEQAIWQILAAAVREALGKHAAIPSIDFDTADRPDLPPFRPTNGQVTPPKVSYNAAYNPFNSPSGAAAGAYTPRPPRDWAQLYAGLQHTPAGRPDDENSGAQTSTGGTVSPRTADPNTSGLAAPAAGPMASGLTIPPADQSPMPVSVGPSVQPFSAPGQGVDAPSADPADPSHGPTATPDASQQTTLSFADNPNGSPATGLMQWHGRYILTSVRSGLLFIDQHRAHVRILFDRYMKQMERQQGFSQGVLFPDVVTLAPSEAAMVDSLHADLLALGFDLTPLGGGSYALQGVPTGIEGLDPVELVRSLVRAAIDEGGNVRAQLQATVARTLAQAAAIVAGQILSQDEMARLVDDLFACQLPAYTPDGRPVLSTLREEDIERMFR